MFNKSKTNNVNLPDDATEASVEDIEQVEETVVQPVSAAPAAPTPRNSMMDMISTAAT
jgi:hypothetical protein